jgi:hypothetical protein
VSQLKGADRVVGRARRRWAGTGEPSDAWKRTARVTDVDWIAKALHMFAWLTPGEVNLYELDGLEDANAWVAA